MKKSKYLLITLISFFSFNSLINAAGTASISVNSSSIENGGSVTATVTLKNTAAWNVTITSSGSTSGCTQKFVGDSGTGNNVTKYFSVTCRSTSTGIINFSMSGDITSSDGVNTKISGNKGVTVVTPRPKSTVNYLSSLGVTGGTLSPVFSKDTLEYYVDQSLLLRWRPGGHQGARPLARARWPLVHPGAGRPGGRCGEGGAPRPG